MRKLLRRVGALALVIAMLLSMLTQGLASNGTQDGASTLSNASPLADGDTTPKNYDAAADVTGKPRLYVDFLGDNAGHNSQNVTTPNGTLESGTTHLHPESDDYSIATGSGNWSRYTDANDIYKYDADATVFYVGVGIDRMNLLKALEAEKTVTDPGTGDEIVTKVDAGGVYSFEAGFYYNPAFVQPYVANGDYAATIADINLSNGTHVNSTALNTHWNGTNYRVVEALTDLAPQFDGGLADLDGDGFVDDWGELTQEVIVDPSNTEIMNSASGWKMTYVSIEMTADALEKALADPATVDPRLEGVYGSNTYDGENTTEYLLIIPFVLKAYDPNNDLCFRLIRNATHLTLGAMDGGNVNYAAWERVTTRNSDTNLKLQTTFTGDLNIFTGEKEKDLEYRYDALLRVLNGGNPMNTAKVEITNDPSPKPIYIDKDREIMTGLASGTGMTVTVNALDQYDVTVNVYLTGDSSKTPIITFDPTGIPSQDNARETTYTFIMPEGDVTVEVIFTLDPNAPKNFEVVLIEDDRLGTDDLTDGSPVGRPDPTDPNNPTADHYIIGNLTTVTAHKRDLDANGDPMLNPDGSYAFTTNKINSESPASYPYNDTSYPSVTATATDVGWDGTVTVQTDLHPDYIAIVTFLRADGAVLSPMTRPVGSSLEQRADAYGAPYYVLTLEESGEYTFSMPASDVYLEIEYVLAPKHTAKLELKHVALDEHGAEVADIVNDLNRAQLSIIGYQDDEAEERLYGSTYKDTPGSIDGSAPIYSTSPDTVSEPVQKSPMNNIAPVDIALSSATGATNGDSDPGTHDDFTDPTNKVAGQDDANISARTGRQVFVAVESSSAHIVDRVEVIDPTAPTDPTDPNYVAPILAAKHADYSNVYTFEMPNYDAQVVVYYKQRTNPNITLEYSGLMSGWESKVEAVGPKDDSLYPTLNSITADGATMEALEGGTVTVTIGAIPDNYTATVFVTTSDFNSVPTSPAGINLKAGDSVTFPMPALDTNVRIVYEEIEKEKHTAIIEVVGLDGISTGGASGVFYLNTDGTPNYNIMTGPEGTHLPGRVYVPTGYYIYAVTATGASSGYPYTQYGNGWDNGRGTGTYVDVTSTMPDEDILINVVLAKGQPPEDPNFGVTLFVKDADNGDTNNDGIVDSTFDDNSAMMKLFDADGDGHLEDRGKVVGYTPVPSGYLAFDTAYTVGGTTVEVNVQHLTDYYIKSVEVSPAYLGVGIVWDDASHFHFTTPEKSISVTVELAKVEYATPEERMKMLTVDKTENGSYASANKSDNTVTELKFNYLGNAVTKPDTGTTIDINGTNVYSTRVDKLSNVTATVQVAGGWRVASARLVYGGYTHYLSLSGLTTDNINSTDPMSFDLSFTMPTKGAELIIDYRDTAAKDGEHTLTLVVDDPYNVLSDTNTVLADNYAELSTDAPPALGPFGVLKDAMSGSTVAVKGETVTVEWSTADGYYLELLTVKAGGGRIAPQYVYTPPIYDTDGTTVLAPAKTIATFTMPDDDTTVLVRFNYGEDRLFRADLVIHEEGDDYGTADNRASFEDTLDLTVADDVYVKGDYVTMLHAGENVDVFISAADGYYIDKITVTPFSSGVTATVTGAFGRQETSFRMPASDVQVNVYFKQGWPTDLGDDPPAKFDVLLTVIDESFVDTTTPYNYAHKLGVSPLVHGGETRVKVDELDDGKTERIHLHSISGSYVESVVIIDDEGNEVDWWWSGAYSKTVEFFMPPSNVEVIVTYAQGDPPSYTATLHAMSRGGAGGTAKLEVVTQDIGEQPDGTIPTGTTATLVTNGVYTPVSLTVDATDTNKNGSITPDIPAGELLRVTANPTDEGDDGNADYILSAIYAIGSDARVIRLYSLGEGGESPITKGGSMSFSMPNGAVDVYVVFDRMPDKYQAIANLEVSGPKGSGNAELMKWNGDDPNDKTDTVGLISTGVLSPAASNYILLGMTQTARVDITPAEGYVLDRVTIVDNMGRPIDYKWIVDTAYNLDDDGDGFADDDMVVEPTYALTYVQPENGSWVKVEFKEREKDDEGNPKTYTAQVVINDAADLVENDANISLDASNIETIVQKYLSNLDPGDRVYIGIDCAEGYRFDIDIVPQSHNIVPTLELADNKSQATSFKMPADNVIVYVRFETDVQPRLNATLTLTGTGGSSYAQLSSDYAATKKHVPMGGSSTVQAIPTEEWVYADLFVANGYYVTDIEVRTISGDYVLYEVDTNGNIRFPMASEDVNIVVRIGTTQPTHNVTLNVLATADERGNGTATLTELNTTNTVTVTGDWPIATDTLPTAVAAGQTLELKATLNNTAYTVGNDTNYYYIDSIYAEYAEGPYVGQRIALDIDGAVYNDFGEIVRFDSATLAMQPYALDVYVVYGVKTPAVDAGDRRELTLEVYGDVGAGSATIVGGTPSITVNAQPAGGSDTTHAESGTQMVLSFTISDGYEIDYISVTPIGTNLGWITTADNSRVFEMPDMDVTIQVHLRRSSAVNYLATLHYVEIEPATVRSHAQIGFYDNAGDHHYTNGTTSTDLNEPIGTTGGTVAANQLLIPEAQRVELGAYINNAGYYVLSAYVLRTDGTMVSLVADGIDGKEHDAGLAPSLPEATTAFVMPPSDVDVYVVIANIPKPADEWTTVALVATDSNIDGTEINMGKRIARITEETADQFIYEIDYEAGGVVNTLRTDDGIYTGEVKSGGNATHKAYIVAVDNTVKQVYVDEGLRSVAPDYQFVHPAVLSASGAAAPVLTHLAATPLHRYVYTMPATDTATKMHYVRTDTEVSLRVELIDTENPGNGSITNKLTVNAPGKDVLELISTTSAGAWQIMGGVPSKNSINFVIDTGVSGFKPTAVLIDSLTGEEIEIELVDNGDGTFSGEFIMPDNDATLRVELTYGEATLSLLDRSTNGGSRATMYVLDENLTLPVDKNPVPPYSGYSLRDSANSLSLVSEGASLLLAEGMNAAQSRAASPQSLTLENVPNATYIETYVDVAEGSRLLAVIGSNARGETELIQEWPANTGSYGYRVYGNTEISVLIDDENGEARVPVYVDLLYPSATELQNLKVENLSDNGSDGGSSWVTAKAGDQIKVTFSLDDDEGRTVRLDRDHMQYDSFYDFTEYDALIYQQLTTNSGYLETPGIYTFTFTMPSPYHLQLNPGQMEAVHFILTYNRYDELSLNVVDYTEKTNNTIKAINNRNNESAAEQHKRSVSYASSDVTLPQNGRVDSVKLGRGTGNEENRAFRITEYSPDAKIAKAFYVSDAGATDLMVNLDDGYFGETAPLTADFTMEPRYNDHEIWVFYKTEGGTIYPDGDKYVTNIVAESPYRDPALNWLDGGCTINGVVDITRPMDPQPSIYWTDAKEGDEVRGTFTVAVGWYAQVYAYRNDTGEEIPILRQNDGVSETVTIEQPDADVTIVVAFYADSADYWKPGEASYPLRFSIIGHDEKAGNTATLTIKDDAYTKDDKVKTLSGDKATDDPEIYDEYAEVSYGAQLELEGFWEDGYSILKVTIEIRDKDENLITTYTVPTNTYDDMTSAWMTAPGEVIALVAEQSGKHTLTDGYTATVCVYYSFEYTATLNYEFLNGGTGSAEMYDNARPSTVVTADGAIIDNLGGGETIRTEPTANAGSRLVGVVYETEFGGARPTKFTDRTTPPDWYDVEMPEEDIDVYVAFEPEDGSSYIAMVTLEGESGKTDANGVQNDAVIRNITRTAVGTDHWQTAQEGDTLEITVTLAEGYQARVTAVYPDPDKSLSNEDGELYVTRTLFRTDGLVSSFTMPKKSDAIVTIEFIEGYSAALLVSDSTTTGSLNQAQMVVGSLDDYPSYVTPNTIRSITANSEIYPISSNEYVRRITYYKLERENGVPITDQSVGDIPSGVMPPDGANALSKLYLEELDGKVTIGSGTLVRLLYSTELGGTYTYNTNRLQLDAGEATLPRGGTANWYVDPLAVGDPVEDIVITAVIVGDEDPYIAKVQLEGDNDINRNTATILNTSERTDGGAWQTGDIWTTAHVNGTNTTASEIKSTISLAPGYTATIIVINDKAYDAALAEYRLDHAAELADGTLTEADAIEHARTEAAMNYYLNGDTGVQHTRATVSASGDYITVTMPSEVGANEIDIDDISDITVIVIFNGEPGARPYDPNNEAYTPTAATEELLEKGWIYGTNHGDYATITVPTLIVNEIEGILDDVYRHEVTTDAGTIAGTSNTFRISVRVDGNLVELKPGVEINIYPASEPVEDAGYPYNTGNYYTGKGEYTADIDRTQKDDVSGIGGTPYAYTGAKFNIELLDVAESEQSDAYKAFAAILENRGSLDAEFGTLLQIRAVDTDGRISEPTQLVIPAYYYLEGTIVSYAPQHTATFTLYEQTTLDDLDADHDGYSDEAHTVSELTQTYGTGEWMQDFEIKSSDLAGRDASTVTRHDLPLLVGDSATEYSGSATYKMTIEKPAALTYTRTGITLEIAAGLAVGGYDDANTERSWILARYAEAAADTASASEVATMSLTEPTSDANDAYSGGADTTPPRVTEGASFSQSGNSIYSNGDDTDPIYGISDDTETVKVESSPSEGSTFALLSTNEEPAPAASTTELVRDVIMLITGDVSPDKRTNQWDYNLILDYIGGNLRWTRASEGNTGWENSTRNPESEAFLCDLNGDTVIDYNDLTVLTADYNYNKRISFYGSPSKLERDGIDDYDDALVDYINEISASTDVSSYVVKLLVPTETLQTAGESNDDCGEADEIAYDSASSAACSTGESCETPAPSLPSVYETPAPMPAALPPTSDEEE